MASQRKCDIKVAAAWRVSEVLERLALSRVPNAAVV